MSRGGTLAGDPARETVTASARPAPYDEGWHEALDLIGENAAELLGFGVAAISLVRDDQLVTLSVACDDEEIRRSILGNTTSVARLLEALEDAEDWGLMKFLPHQHLSDHIKETGWVSPGPAPAEPDAWHPEDLLTAPLHGSHGELLGFLSVDVPVDGRRPGAEQRRMLDKVAVQATRAVVNIVERERLSAQLQMVTAARRVLRHTTGQLSVADLLDGVEDELVNAFGAQGMWIQIFDEGPGQGLIRAAHGVDIVLPAPLVRIARETAQRCWRLQVANVVGHDDPRPEHVTPQEQEEIVRFQEELGIASSLFAPLGAGTRCLGNLVITRGPGQPPFNQAEIDIALDLGHDLGQAVVNARVHERRHELVAELQALDSYKSQLIATLSHELKNPLTSVMGYLEILESLPEAEQLADQLEVIARNGHRTQRLVGDMLTLSRLAGSDLGERQAVDLVECVRSAAAELPEYAEPRDVELVVTLPPGPAEVVGEPDDLARLCLELAGSAVLRTPPGSRVTLELGVRADQVVLTCRDAGGGVDQGQLDHLFSEFFRTDLDTEGTGLGMAIVKRIAERHRGGVAAEIGPDGGTVVTVRLPAAATRP